MKSKAIKGKEQIKSDSIANFYSIIKDKIKISCKEKTFRENVIRALNTMVVFIMDTLTKNWGWFNEV